MTRIIAVAALLLAVAVAATAPAEIVKVTAERTQIYDSETQEYKSVGVQGKRFMVYGAGTDWYVVQMKINGESVFRWIPKADVAVDLGTAKTETVRVVEVVNPNLLRLEGGKLIQFAGITVVMEDWPLKRQTLAWLKRTLEGQEVVLEYDSKIGKNTRGYEQAYVYAGDTFVNRTLVQYGLAKLARGYADSKARYATVFAYFVQEARKNGIGQFADETAAPGAAPPEAQAEAAETAGADREQVARHLTDAERAQWERNLGTEIRAKSHRDTDTTSQDDCSDGDCDTTYIKSIVDVRTLTVSVRNGWGFPIEGMTAKYDLFAKMGKTSDTAVLVKSGEITGMNIASGQTQEFSADPVELRGTDSSKDGWSGRKYYGYRVTFVYKGTVVKVVAAPTSLTDFGSSTAVR